MVKSQNMYVLLYICDASCDRYDRVYDKCINDRGSHHLHDGFFLRAERIRLAAKPGLNKALTEARNRDRFLRALEVVKILPPKNQRFDRLSNLIINHWIFKHQLEDLRTKTGVSAKDTVFLYESKFGFIHPKSGFRWIQRLGGGILAFSADCGLVYGNLQNQYQPIEGD